MKRKEYITEEKSSIEHIDELLQLLDPGDHAVMNTLLGLLSKNPTGLTQLTSLPEIIESWVVLWIETGIDHVCRFYAYVLHKQRNNKELVNLINKFIIDSLKSTNDYKIFIYGATENLADIYVLTKNQRKEKYATNIDKALLPFHQNDPTLRGVVYSVFIEEGTFAWTYQTAKRKMVILFNMPSELHSHLSQTAMFVILNNMNGLNHVIDNAHDRHKLDGIAALLRNHVKDN
jgi:hypothetical protein